MHSHRLKKIIFSTLNTCKTDIFYSILFLKGWYVPVLVFSDAVTKYRRLGGSNNRDLFLMVLDAKTSKIKCCHSGFPVRALFLACKASPPHCILRALVGGREDTSSLCLFDTDTNTSWSRVNLLTSQMAPSPNTTTLGTGCQHTSVEGCRVQSTIPSYNCSHAPLLGNNPQFAKLCSVAHILPKVSEL